jgi:nicotinate-nucleotide adenylyltransferase
MGGTFDPIHLGHLILAECAYEQFSLDRILFLPAGNPPHKTDRPDGASDQERLDMVRLAIEGNPHFQLDPSEMQRGGLTYTCETLRLMKEKHPETEYYFIIGADSLMTFDTWKDPALISHECILLAAVRDGMETDEMEEKIAELGQRYGAQIHLLRSPNIDISSSHLRKWYREGRSIRYYIPDRVLDYIQRNHVYHEGL